MQQNISRAAWAEIDLSAAAANLRAIRRRVTPLTKIIAVVKADAYGHGAVELSRVLLDAGTDLLAVATPDELRTLRESGISAPVLILGYVPDDAIPQVLRLDGILTVYRLHQAEVASYAALQLGKKAFIHLKVDSGMGRIGLTPDEAGVAEAAAIAALPGLVVSGVFSHFALSDSIDQTFTIKQLRVFNEFVAACGERGVNFPLRHIANSAAILRLPETYLDAVRPGIILYGCAASDELDSGIELQPVMSVKARIVRLHRVAAGTPISYGCTWRAGRDSLIATLPLGYADGVSRLLSNQGEALVREHRAPFSGRVCMDQLMLDVTDIPGVTEGDEAVLLGRQGREKITAEQMAAMCGTINYEVLCHLGARLPRVYIK